MNKDSLIVFVHAPKTAGSTVNEALRQIGDGDVHVEKYAHNPDLFKDNLKNKKWISGHIHIDRFEQLLEGVDRPVRYFSAVREPVAQVRSHYNWLMEIYFKGKSFYDNHPENIKAISEDLRASDRSRPEKIIEKLEEYSGLFLNTQSQFILGNKIASVDDVKDALLNRFEYISNGDDLDYMYKTIAPGLSYSKRENVSNYHFDPNVFETDKVVDFLKEKNSIDFAIFDALKKRKLVKLRRKSFRFFGLRKR